MAQWIPFGVYTVGRFPSFSQWGVENGGISKEILESWLQSHFFESL